MRHAYLIVAHNNFYNLEVLMKLLDDPRNDLYIHIDKKVKMFDFEYFSNICKLSRCIFLNNRIAVYWGHHSQVETELNLLEEAMRGDNYSYFHLISGADLPIKDQNYIHNFFEKNNGKEFISIVDNGNALDRLRYYHFFKGRLNFIPKSKNRLISKIPKIIILLQKKLGINRTKNSAHIQKASQWFSITNSCAKFVLSNRKKIICMTKYTHCADEMFL